MTENAADLLLVDTASFYMELCYQTRLCITCEQVGILLHDHLAYAFIKYIVNDNTIQYNTNDICSAHNIKTSLSRWRVDLSNM